MRGAGHDRCLPAEIQVHDANMRGVHRGGMAEWSMAVVLKTSRIGYDVAVVFCRDVPAPHLQYQAHDSCALSSFRARSDNRSPKRSRISLSFGLFFSRVSHARDT